MTWIDDTQYQYTTGVLKAIAEWYESINIVLMIWDRQILEPFSLVEYKADFDIALSSIGRHKWEGLQGIDFGNYRHYGRLQRVVIADMLGITDYELEAFGFFNIPQYRHVAYKRMADSLNGKNRGQLFTFA